MCDLSSFGLRDMTACGAALREMGAGAESMEEVACQIIRRKRIPVGLLKPACKRVNVNQVAGNRSLGSS